MPAFDRNACPLSAGTGVRIRRNTHEGPLRDRFEALAGPERVRLRAELPATQRELEEILVSRRAYRHFELAHPEAMRRVDLLDDEIATAAWELDVKRQDIDGIRPPPPRVHASGRGIERANLNRVCSMDLEIGL